MSDSYQTLLTRVSALERQHAADMAEMRREIERLRRLAGPAASSSHPASNAGALITRDDMNREVIRAVKSVIPIATEQALVACRSDIMPHVKAVSELAERTATYVAYQLSDVETQTTDYRKAVLASEDTGGGGVKRITGKGAPSRREIIPGAVSFAFDDNEYVS
jgi:hypothetical protein